MNCVPGAEMKTPKCSILPPLIILIAAGTFRETLTVKLSTFIIPLCPVENRRTPKMLCSLKRECRTRELADCYRLLKRGV